MAKEADRLNRVVSELLNWLSQRIWSVQADLNTLINHSLQLVSQDANSRDPVTLTANDTLPVTEMTQTGWDSGPAEFISSLFRRLTAW